MKQKGFAHIVVFLIIALVLVVFGATYLVRNGQFPTSIKNKFSRTDSASSISASEIYKSPLGLSFKKPSRGTINEASYDISGLPNLKDEDLVYPPMGETTTSSVGTIIGTEAYSLTVTRLDAVGTVPDEIIGKMAYGGGDFFLFLGGKAIPFFKEVEGLAEKTIDPTDIKHFVDKGQTKEYGVTSYSNPNSKLFGIKLFSISGFEVPGQGLFVNYYLFDEKKKYIIKVVSSLSSCEKKEQLESEHKTYISEDKTEYTIDPSFNSNEYIRKLHLISQDCENTSKNKADLNSLLDSIRVNY